MAKLSDDKKSVVVQRGDTLSEIAVEFKSYTGGKTYQQLAAINNISNPDLIYVGQTIKFESSDTSSSSTAKPSAKTVTKKQFGLQASVTAKDILLAVWQWDRPNTDHYELKWKYWTTDKIWFTEREETTTYTYATFDIPENAKKVRLTVKPIAKTYKSGNKEVKYWSDSTWSPSDEFEYKVVKHPAMPSVPDVTLDGFKLTAEVKDLQDDPSIVEFQIWKDDISIDSTIKSAVTKTATASASKTVAAGSRYKVRCRSKKNNVYSEWSGYSNNFDTIPATPAELSKCEPKSLADPASIYIEWPAINNAKTYEVQYTTKKSNFDSSDQVTSKTGIEGTSWEISAGIETGKEYFFRVRAVNDQGSSGWSAISSTVIGTGPAAPTTWSSTTTVVSGEPLTLYWIHNSQDGSKQHYAELDIYVDGVKQAVDVIDDSDSEDTTSFYKFKMVSDNGTPLYADGAVIQWAVRTAGISKEWGEWSVQRRVDIYAPATVDLTVPSTLSSLPLSITAVAEPVNQKPIGYHISIVAEEGYETVDNVGNAKIVGAGDVIFSKHYDTPTDQPHSLTVNISAGDISLEDRIEYTVKCSVSMNSGLTGENSASFTVHWGDVSMLPTAEVTFDEETYAAYIRPYCATYETRYYTVTRSGNNYIKTDSVISGGVYGLPVTNAVTTTGEEVYNGITSDGANVYYCIVYEETLYDDVLMAVYRREYDGSFTEIESGLDGSKNVFVTDPHPALDYARYRIVATSKTNGSVVYNDVPGIEVGCKSVIIQWDEAWSTFDAVEGESEDVDTTWSGSLLELPYNIDVSNKTNMDVAVVEYIGRKHPVTYYGTQLGETASWAVSIDREDRETLYALRRLSVWQGDVYVREPSGSGYWANIKVSFSQKHTDLTIPVTMEITRVEGGV